MPVVTPIIPHHAAALSAVAWSRPYVIMQRSRATGAAAASFVDRIDFYSGGLKTMEVSERVPLVTSTNAWIYARSSEAGEIWPAVYEKAFAKWKTNDATDEPNSANVVDAASGTSAPTVIWLAAASNDTLRQKMSPRK